MGRFTKATMRSIIASAKKQNTTVSTIGGGRIKARQARFQIVKLPNKKGYTAIARRK
jgi:hypothetical protein